MKSYSEKLKDPRWQKKRLEILNRDRFECQFCHEDKKTLHVHHLHYQNCEPWESDNDFLITLCHECHELESTERRGAESDLLCFLKLKKLPYSNIRYISEALCKSDIDLRNEYQISALCEFLEKGYIKASEKLYQKECRQIDNWLKENHG